MSPQFQKETMSLLADVCSRSGEVRLGQLLAHLGFLGEDQTGRSLWDIEDEQLLAVLRSHLAELSARTASATPVRRATA